MIEDKAVGELWRGYNGPYNNSVNANAVVELIRKLAEERAAKLYYKAVEPDGLDTKGHIKAQSDACRQQALRDFGIDPETFNAKRATEHL